MNTGDYCPRGRELYAEWWALEMRYERSKLAAAHLAAILHAYQAYRQHVDKCTECNQIAHEEE